MYSFDPVFFFTFVPFRVDGRWGASLSKTWPSCIEDVVCKMAAILSPGPNAVMVDFTHDFFFFFGGGGGVSLSTSYNSAKYKQNFIPQK